MGLIDEGRMLLFSITEHCFAKTKICNNHACKRVSIHDIIEYNSELFRNAWKSSNDWLGER